MDYGASNIRKVRALRRVTGNKKSVERRRSRRQRWRRDAFCRGSRDYQRVGKRAFPLDAL